MSDATWERSNKVSYKGKFLVALVILMGVVTYNYFIGLTPTQSDYMDQCFALYDIKDVTTSYSSNSPDICEVKNPNNRTFSGYKEGRYVHGAFCWNSDTTQGGPRFYKSY